MAKKTQQKYIKPQGRHGLTLTIEYDPDQIPDRAVELLLRELVARPDHFLNLPKGVSQRWKSEYNKEWYTQKRASDSKLIISK